MLHWYPIMFIFLWSCPASSDKEKILEYLVYCGFLDPWVLQNEEQILPMKLEEYKKNALKEFQTSIGLQATGELDEETEKTIKYPRCHMKNGYILNNGSSREKRFAVFGKPWLKDELTYRISKYPTQGDFSSYAVDDVVEQAFSMWEEATNLEFHAVPEQADITIEFTRLNYTKFGDAFGYVKKQKVLMNDDWTWSIRNNSGKDLFKAIMHELGHVLGLQHSAVLDSIMQSRINLKYNPDFKLHDDDVKGIQFLYGLRKQKLPDLCSDSSFDAIFQYPEGETYILKGKYYWKLIPDGIASGYPRIAAYRWPGLPSDVDAATATKSGLTYFFKGNKYWTYQDTTPCDSNPSYISVGWPGIPDNVDAVMWGGQNKFYFFKGDAYWKYDTRKPLYLRASYPKPVSDWGDMEGHLDDVLYTNTGYVFFFKRGYYYRYNCNTELVDYDIHQSHYPRLVSLWWFHCRSK